MGLLDTPYPNYMLGDGNTLSARNPSLREKTTDWLRGLLYTDDREGQDKAEYLNRVAETMIPPYGVAAAANDATNDIAQGNYGTAALTAGLMMVPGPKTKGGKPIDPTATGWVFKDVAKPHALMQKGDWAKYNRSMDFGDWTEADLPIGSLYATQHSVNADFSAPMSRNTELPMVMKKDGKFFVMDGHHRITAAAAKGSQTTKVRLIDLDGTTQTDFPLLDWANHK